MLSAMGVLDLLLPPACAGCRRTGSLLCDDCLATLHEPSRPEDRFAAADAGTVVGVSLSLAVAAFAYEGALRRALAALKYAGASRLAPILAAAADPAVRRLREITGPATLVPIPVHRDRRRERGYDQAELLARAIAGPHGWAVATPLVRVRPTTKQHRLDRAARLHNLRGAFAARARPPPAAILVDDIITTTATLEACGTVLLEAGCERVYGFAVAREV